MQAQAAFLSAEVVAADARLEAPVQQAAVGIPLPLVRYLTQGFKSLTTSLQEIAASEAGTSKRSIRTAMAEATTLNGFMVKETGKL